MGYMLGVSGGALIFAIAVAVTVVRNTSCGQHIGAGMGNGMLVGVLLWMIQTGPLADAATSGMYFLWILAAIAGVWVCAWLITCFAYDADTGQGIVIATIVSLGNGILWLIWFIIRQMI